MFGELTENITLVIRYFNNQVEKARGYGGWDWSVEKVLDVIKGAPTASLLVGGPLHQCGALMLEIEALQMCMKLELSPGCA